MVNSSIKILVIDDLQDNLITLDALIKDAFPKAIVLKAQNGEKGLELAAKENPDVILLDILMPEMDGYEVCQKLKADKELSDIPVVFVTAIENTKEALVKALESGGEAFLTKPIDEIELTAQIRAMLKIREANSAKKDEKVRLEKLVEERSKALVQELEARKRAEEKLRESEEEFRGIYEQSPIAIEIYDKNGKLIDVNQQTLNMFGVDNKKHVIGFDLWADPNLSDEKMKLLKSGQEIFLTSEFDFEIVKKHKLYPTSRSGKIYMDMYAIPLFNDKQVTGFLVQMVETTERKQAEEKLKESEEKFKTIVENGSVLLTLTDSLGRVEFASPQCERVIGWKEEDIIGVSMPDFIHPDDKLRVAAEQKKLTINQPIKNFEYRIIDKENKIRWISHSAAIIRKGDTISILSTITNFTERKQAEEALKESEEKFRALYDNAPLSYQSLNEDGSFKDVNPTWLSTLGYERDEVIGAFYKDLLHPDWQAHFEENFPAFKKRGYVNDVQFKIRHKKGHYLDISFEGCIGYNPDGSFKQTYCVFQDITERKLAEEKLKESEEKYRVLFEKEENAIFIYESDTFIIVDANPAMTKTYGYSYDELIGMNALNLSTEIEKSKNAATEADKKGKVDVKLRWHKKKDGTVFPLELQVYQTVLEGRTVGFAVAKDITERKMAEEALKENEAMLQAAMDNSQAGIAIAEVPSGKLKYVNKAGLLIRGKEYDEIAKDIDIDKYVSSWQIMHPDGTPYKPEDVPLARAVLNGETVREEFIIRRDDLEDRYVLAHAAPINNDNGKRIAAIVVFLDITKRKQAEEKIKAANQQLQANEEALRVSEERLDLAMMVINEGIWDWNLVSNQVDFDERYYTMAGYEPGDFTNNLEEFQKRVHPEDVDFVMSTTEQYLAGQIKQFLVEFRFKCKDGSWMWVQGRGQIVERDKKGTPLRFIGTHSDITERKQAEKELTKLSTSVEQSPSVITITDTKGNLQYVNPKFTESTGYSIDEVIGQNPRVLKSGEQSDEFYRELWETISSGKVWHGEFHNKKKNSGLFWELASVSPIFDKQGKIINYIKVAEDITERKQAEDNFRHSIDESPLGIRIVNQKGKTIYVNKALLDIYEFSSLDEFINTESIERYTEQSYQQHQERKKIRQAGGDTSDYEISIRRKNGEIRHIKVWRKEVIWNREKHFQVINQDVTELKRLNIDLIQAKEKAEDTQQILQKQKNEIESNNARLESLLTIARLTTDSAKTVLDESLQEATKLTGSKIGYIFLYDETSQKLNLHSWSNEAMNECKVPNYQLVYDLNKTGCWGEAIRQKGPFMLNDYVAESTYKKGTPEGHVALHKFLTIPVTRNNQIVAVIGVANKETDYNNIDIQSLDLLADSTWKILERIEFQKNLREAKEKAEESNRLKTAFLNNMSHEIRTPLNGITGFIGLLQDSEIDDKQKQEFFDIINKSSDRLIATVTDIMDISRIEAGEVMVSKTEVSINEILEEQYSFFYHQAQSKGLELIYKSDLSDNESRIVTDQHKLEGILINLIKNAIKFTEEGEITFACSLKKEQEIHVLEFYVKDTGIGIPANRVDAIFNRFEQADIADTRVFEGSGLGLAIAKSYVEMLGGKISVKSIEGEGSTFTFSLPCTKPFEKKSNAKRIINKETQTALSNLSVIIAEDDEASIMYFDAIFKNEFKNISYAKTGQEVIDKCRANPETDLILMDIKMPVMNGYDATREIRKFNSNVIIIAQTAFGLTGDREKAIKAGCNDYISKPIKKDELLTLIQNSFKNKHNKQLNNRKQVK